MKKFLVSVSILCTATLAMAQWLPDVRLTNDPGVSWTSSNNARAIVASGDSVHVVWYDNRDGNYEIYYKRATDGGISWGADTRLTSALDNSYAPSMALSGLVVHVVWADDRNGDREIYYKRSEDGGSTWGVDTRLTNAARSSESPSMAISGSVVHVVWYDERDDPSGNWYTEIYYKRSTDGGLTWGPDTRLTNILSYSGFPCVAVSGSVVHVVWEDDRDGSNGEGSIYYKRSTDGGTTWGADTPLTEYSLDSWDPCIAVLDSVVHVVWFNGFYWGPNDIYYKRSTDGGTTWEDNIQFTNYSAISHYPTIAVSGSLVHVTWGDTRDGSAGEVYYKRSEDEGVSWEEDIQLTTAIGESDFPFIAVSDSALHVVWYETRDGNEEIYYKRNPTGNVILPTWTIEQNSLQEQLVISPNPASTRLNISFQSFTTSHISAKLINMNGQTIMISEFVISEGMNHVSLNIKDVSDGIYSLVLVNETQRYFGRVVIMN